MDNAGTYLIYYIDEDLNIAPLQTVNRLGRLPVQEDLVLLSLTYA